jgi:geranylgeranyl pyrophosphate synthase
MNDPSIALPTPNPRVALLDEHFSEQGRLEAYGPAAARLNETLWNVSLRSPLADFLDRPSKEFRANLLASSYELAGGQGPCPPALIHAIEALHAGSLIIDDIQDKSTVRRGRPALHCEYGVPIALNAGNWLYFWAFRLLDEVDLEPTAKLGCYRWMNRLLLACHEGQALDLTARIDQLDRLTVPDVVLMSTTLKTGSLMKLAAVVGACAANASDAVVMTLGSFGERLGVALQMLDDLAGVLSEKHCHKGHEDLLLGRPTWPWAWLASELPSARYLELTKLAKEVIARDTHPELLARALRSELQGSGRVRVRRSIQGAFAELRAQLGPSEALARVEQEIRRLERSYG